MADKIVLFGGTFNPIHRGHTEPVLAASEQIGADKLIFIPCHIPPHKAAPNVSSEQRLAMTQLAAAELDKTTDASVSCSRYEIDQQGQSFTRLTVEYFAKQYPDAQLYFLIGMDSYLNFTKWYKWQEILDYCQLLVIQRPGYDNKAVQQPQQLVDKSRFVTIPPVDISSSQLREKTDLAQLKPWLLTPVYQHIKENKLYL